MSARIDSVLALPAKGLVQELLVNIATLADYAEKGGDRDGRLAINVFNACVQLVKDAAK